MKRLTYFLTALAILSILLIACEKTGGGGGTNYFPNKDQTVWTFTDDYGNYYDITYKLNGTINHSTAGEVQIINVTSGDQTWDVYLKVTTSGVTLYFDLDSDDRWELLHYPIKVNDTWSWTSGGYNWSAKVEVEEKVQTPAGEFTSLKISYKIEDSQSDIVWFNSGKGWVRDLYTDPEDPSYNYDFKLKSFNQPS